MASPYIGEIRIIAWNYAPKGWAFCNGQTLAINQNQALFALLGTVYGGNGQTTFLLPNLQGKSANHFGNGFNQGQVSGETAHTLTLGELPAHTHTANGSSNSPNINTPNGNFWPSNTGVKPYAASGNVQMSPIAVTPAGGGQSHDNMPPYLVVNYVIALVGIFPSRN